MRRELPVTRMLICYTVLLLSLRQATAQTPQSQISADWKTLGWILPENFSRDQIPLFKGLNAACGTWSFEADLIEDLRTVELKGKLVASGGSQAGMASAWNLVWSWPAENPQHVVVENIVAMPERHERFGLMLVRIGTMSFSKARLNQKPKTPPTIFLGKWDAQLQTIKWTRERKRAKKQDEQSSLRENTPAPSFEMVVTPVGKISIQNSENLPAGHLSAGRVTARTENSFPEHEDSEFLTGVHHVQSAAEIPDPRIMRYLPAEATDIRLISDRNGHMAHYRISAKDFDAFLTRTWQYYRKERAAKPDSWVDYSEREISSASNGSPVGRYVPKVRSTEISFENPISWPPLENATSYEGPRKKSAAGATYYFDRETGIAYHEAGYW